MGRHHDIFASLFERVVIPRLWLRNCSILERAALRELIDLPAVITQLQATSFYAPAEIIAAMLDREADPKTSGEP